jgi:hypothetical protein
MWVSNKFIGMEQIRLFNNSAFYGNNFASYPQDLKISFKSNGDYFNNITLKEDKRMLNRVFRKLQDNNSSS